MLNRTIGLFVVCCVSMAIGSGVAAGSEPGRVLVVYNSNWKGDADKDGVQDSLQVANYYAARRGVPAANVLGVACTTGSYYYYSSAQYTNFCNEMVLPIKSKLSALGATNIDVILTCYGVPYQVANSGGSGVCLDNALMIVNYLGSTNNVASRGNPYFETTPTFGTDKGHFSHSTYKYAGTEMYLVTRLDGPNAPWGPMSLVDQALYGERYIHENAGCYKGNVYVDSRYATYTDAGLTADSDVINGSYGSYGSADKNMAYAEHYTIGRGLPLKWQNTSNDAEIGNSGSVFQDGSSAERAEAALFYGGWYNFSKYNDAWYWLPGSVACDLNSNSCSASSLRGGSQSSFGVASLERGASCVSGVLNEPYLTGHQRPNVLLYYLLQGYCFAEASALSQPNVGGWMEINVGDPLYAPLKAKTAVLDTQAPQLAAGFPAVAGTFNSGTRIVTVAVGGGAEPDVATIRVDYGLTTAYGQSVETTQGYWGGKVFTLSGLQRESAYHYRVTLTDPAGHVTVSGDYIFTTGVFTNTAPTALDQTAVVEHDKASAVILAGTDPEGNALTYAVVSSPNHGALSACNGAVWTYTPSAGFSGTDSFTFKVSDGKLESAAATVTVKVMSTEAVTVVFQQGLDGYAGARDTYVYDGSTDRNYGGSTGISTYDNGKRRILVGFDVSSIPADATVASARLEAFCSSYSYGSNNRVVGLYRITRSWDEGTRNGDATGQNGATWQEYTYTDHTASGAGDWTAAGGDCDSSEAGRYLTGERMISSWRGWDIRDLVQYWVANPAENHGALVRTLNGSISIGYYSRNHATVERRPKLAVTYFPADSGGNHGPVATAQGVTTAEDTAKAIVLAGTDADGNPLTFSIVSSPLHGALSGTAPNVTYAPAANYNGPDSFTFKANDGQADSAAATVSIAVTAVNDAPVANAQSVTTAEDTARAITLAGTDADGDALAFSIVGNPSHGILSGVAPNVTYTPAADYSGPDSFTFKVNDGQANSNVATVLITVTAVNDLPVAVADVLNGAYTVGVGEQVTLTGSSSYDPDNQPAGGIQSYSWSQLAGPSVALNLADPMHPAFTPSAPGAYTFKLVVNDGADNSTDASSPDNTVTITVEAAADIEAPSVPQNLVAVAVSSSRIDLAWGASTDNVGVAGYDVFRGGVKVATVTGTSHSDTGLAAGTAYTYQVEAFDAAGNRSGKSAAAGATTPAQPAEQTIVLQQGLDGYAGCADTTLDGYSTTSAQKNYGGGTLINLWQGGGTADRYGLVKFDLGSVPAGSTVVSAKLELYCQSVAWPYDDGRVYLKPVTRAWVEGNANGTAGVPGATWYEWDYLDHNATAANNWTTFGGDFGANVDSRQTATATWVSFDVTASVQAMLAGTVQNNGYGLVPAGTSGVNQVRFCSSEYATDQTLRPKLTVVVAGN